MLLSQACGDLLSGISENIKMYCKKIAALDGSVLLPRLLRLVLLSQACGDLLSGISENELRHEKTNVLVSDLVRHKPGRTATEDG